MKKSIVQRSAHTALFILAHDVIGFSPTQTLSLSSYNNSNFVMKFIIFEPFVKHVNQIIK